MFLRVLGALGLVYGGAYWADTLLGAWGLVIWIIALWGIIITLLLWVTRAFGGLRAFLIFIEAEAVRTLKDWTDRLNNGK